MGQLNIPLPTRPILRMEDIDVPAFALRRPREAEGGEEGRRGQGPARQQTGKVRRFLPLAG